MKDVALIRKGSKTRGKNSPENRKTGNFANFFELFRDLSFSLLFKCVMFGPCLQRCARVCACVRVKHVVMKEVPVQEQNWLKKSQMIFFSIFFFSFKITQSSQLLCLAHA